MKAMKPLRLSGLAELASLRRALQEEQQRAEQRRAAEAAAQAAAERERRFFADAVGPVRSLRPHQRALLRALPLPSAEPRQRLADEQQALREAMSDEVDIESLLLTDDGLSFRRPGVHSDVLARLRRGHWAIQGEIDLHGLRRDEAREQLMLFLRQSTRQGRRCLRVVHGKGHGSPGRQPVLKAKVQRWLAQSADVIAFAQARGAEGGAGALIVLLAGSARA